MTLTELTQQYLADVTDIGRARFLHIEELTGMSNSSLLRRLGKEGTSFFQLRTEERMRRCKALLDENPGATCHELTKASGYTEAQTFSKVFPVWFGCGLREYKHSIGGK